MPFTPYHFGPGAAIKAVMPKHFSFTVFCFSQVATDCETGYYMLAGMYPWHRFFHTFPGATLMGFACVLVGRPLCQLVLRFWMAWRAAPFRRFYYPQSSAIPLRSAICGAFLGTYSHVLLDSIMHGDLHPFTPFSEANPFYRLVSFATMHIFCLASGILGGLCAVRQNRNG